MRHVIECEDGARWRQAAAWMVRGIGVAIGAALAAIYLALLISSPPDIDWPHARFRAVAGLYLMMPALLLAGPAWAAFWLASRISPRQMRPRAVTENDRETDL